MIIYKLRCRLYQRIRYANTTLNEHESGINKNSESPECV